MARPKKFSVLEPGDLLRPQNILNPIPHRVVRKEVTDFTSGTIKLVTNLGEWTVSPTDDAVFPRRDDGSTRDWKNGEALVTDLCVGDTLPGADGDESVRRTVTSVRRLGVNSSFARIGFSTAESPVFRQDYPLGAPISFPAPMMESSFRPRRVITYRDITTVYGPYGDYDTYDTFRWLFIAKHPSGHGRWPGFFKPLFKDYRGFRIGENTHVIRPRKDDWPAFYGKPENRHPNDPEAYVSPTTREVPTVEEALDAIKAL